jgi:wyosine [tRNA(Phe)-imidazoG37] synthetase (radical SAM superfamily)
VKQRLIYGPVPSRRLGYSLGVDLVPHKVCSYDCIYCQLGRTKQKTIERKPYTPAEDILNQVHQKLKEGLAADYITLAGSGEPTLSTEIGPLIQGIKKLTDIPIAVLTNGSLLGTREVREALMEADAVLPSLDAHDEEGFQTINRPHPEIRLESVLEGLLAFRKEYPGQIWLEVFILSGLNATPTDATHFKHWIDKMNPQKVHVNTAVRPSAETYARKVPAQEMATFCSIIGEKAEVITPFKGTERHEGGADLEEGLLNILARRPCTLDDIVTVLNVHKNEVLKHIEPLVKNESIAVVSDGGVAYYKLKDPL